jgi:hypothetical protein
MHSIVTGRRGISLPFTDWCQVLADAPDGGAQLWGAAVELGRRRGWRAIEGRDTSVLPSGFAPALEFYGHELELHAGQQVLFAGLEPAVRRAIRKSNACGLTVEITCDPKAMSTYYDLHCVTRKRHGLPPQPFGFFKCVAEFLLAKGQGIVVLARHGDRPVAAAVFLHSADRAVYKFGASDAAAHEMRPNNLVMWQAICYYAKREFKSLHLGRTSLSNDGLRRFKRGFGAREHRLAYYSYDLRSARFLCRRDRACTCFRAGFRLLPRPLFCLVGRLLYPHLT